jgi:hypothetical protein
MKILVKDIPVYYLNPDFYRIRKELMEDFLDSINLKHERIPSNSTAELRQVRINEGFIKLAKRAIENAKYPFLVLEDDARLVTDLPESITIPDEAKLIYWGISLWECGGIKPNLYISEYNDEYYRMYHSLGCHAILVPNKESAEHFIKINQKAIEMNDYSDIYFAVDSKDEIYLTPKKGPFFYQNDAHTQPITNFSWENVLSKYLK